MLTGCTFIEFLGRCKNSFQMLCILVKLAIKVLSK